MKPQIKRIMAYTMLRFLLITFVCYTTFADAPATQNIAVFMRKYAPLSNEENHLLQTTQLAILSHCPKDVSCFFVDPRDVANYPEKFVPFLRECTAWVGPMLAQETMDLVNVLQPHIPNFPTFFSFSNNTRLLAHGVVPMGPSPLHDIPAVLHSMNNRIVHAVLVLAPHKWAQQITDMVVKHTHNVKVFFFFYDQKPSPEAQEALESALKTYAPDALFAPFGDMATLELLSNGISFIFNHVGIKPFVMGTSSWTQAFLTDLSLIGALYTKLPLSQKGVAFKKEFKDLFGVHPPHIAITAYDTLCVAFTTTQQGHKDTHNTCRGVLSLTPQGAFYHPTVQTL